MQQQGKEAKVRIYELAKKLDVESKVLIDLCQTLGYQIKNQLSSLDPDQCETLKARLAKGSKPATPSAAPTPPVAPTRIVDPAAKIRNLTPTRRDAAKPVAEPVPVSPPLPVVGPPVDADAPVTKRPEPKTATPAPAPPPVVEPIKPVPAPESPPSVAETPSSPVAPAKPLTPPVEPIPVAPPPVAIVPPPPTPAEPPVAPSTAGPAIPVPAAASEIAPSAASSAKEPPVTATAAPPPPTQSAPPTSVSTAPAPEPILTPPSAVATAPTPPTSTAITPPASPTIRPPEPTAYTSKPLVNLNRPIRQLDARPRPAPTSRPTPPVPTPPVPTPATPTPPTPTVTGSTPPTTPPRPSGSTPASGSGTAARPPIAGPGPRPIQPSGPQPGPNRGPAAVSSPGLRPGPAPTPAGGSRRPGDRERRPIITDRRSMPQGRGADNARPAPAPQRGGQQGPNNRAAPPSPGAAGPAKPASAPGQAIVRFTAEQMEALRKGSITDVSQLLKPTPPPKPTGPAVGQPPIQVPSTPQLNFEGEADEEGDKVRPGKVSGRDGRHQNRAVRAEKRKAKTDVVVQDGHVVVIEDESGRVRSNRKPLLKVKKPITLPRKSGKIPITEPITVRTLSEAIGMKVPELLLKLRSLGAGLLTINSALDIDAAEMIALEAGCELDIRRQEDAEEALDAANEKPDDPSRMEPRPPIVTIMGHVDHGKTSLLDRIRQSNITATEAGGITQVIRAWRVQHNNKPITFLDTPGHEAFTKMRARGAQVTDIAVIVVAADDGVMPQTEEAINHAKAAGVAMVVAINKIDLPNANIKKTEQQLYGLEVLPDTMGGDTPFVYTSAATGKGIDDLLEAITIVAELRELKANPHRPAIGTCLEAHLSGDEGVFATLLVRAGTLRKGDIVLCGPTYGRVRAMYDDLNRPITEAGPSMPVRITGLEAVPNADDSFQVIAELAQAREISEKRAAKLAESSLFKREPVKLSAIGEQKITELKVIVKADFRGSIEAIRKELEKLTHDEVRVRILHTGIGAITESDVQLALTSPTDTMIVGFNAVPDDNALRLAEERGIPIREYNIIYNLTNDVKAALEGKLKPREEIVHLGRAIIRETFKIRNVGVIAGCYVTQGVIERSAKVRVIREGSVIYPPPERTVGLESLKHFKDDVREVKAGFECGMKIAGYDDVKVGDVIEAYRVEQVMRKL